MKKSSLMAYLTSVSRYALLYVPAVFSMLLCVAVILKPAFAQLFVLLFMAMVTGVLFCIGYKVHMFRKELDRAFNSIVAASTPSKATKTTLHTSSLLGASAMLTKSIVDKETVVTEISANQLSLTPQELEELKKKVVIH